MNTELRIFVFFFILRALLWFLHRNPQSVVSRVAFSWIGPLPIDQELFACFQLRWAIYSFGWLCQFAIAIAALLVVGTYFPNQPEQVWFKVFLFALPLGFGIAALATIGFLFKAGKAHWFGPNPQFGGFERTNSDLTHPPKRTGAI